MINRQPSGQFAHLRYALLFLIVFTVAFACQLIGNNSSHKYIQQSGDDLFSIITAKTLNKDLDTLRQELSQRHIKFDITKLIRLANGQIGQLAGNIQVPKPGHPIDVGVGSSFGQSPIPVLGLRCNQTGCQLSFVDDQFPKRLIKLAKQESTQFPAEVQENHAFSDANSAFGLYRVFFRNDFLESNFFGLRNTAIRMTPDYHLDLYPEYQKAVVFLDGREISRRELTTFYALDLKKVVVFKGEAAVLRLGDVRAKNGLVLLYRLPSMDRRDKYTSTRLLERVYPQLFAQH